MSVTSALPRKQAVARILEQTGRPAAKYEKPWLVLMVGLPGSGKSTFARKLARETGAVILESDALRKALFDAPTHESDESKQLFGAIYDATRLLLESGASVIIDATNLRERDRRPAYDAAAATGVQLLVLHFKAPEAVTAQRLSGRDNHVDPDDQSTAGMGVYARMAETEEPLSRAHWEIETSDVENTQAALRRAIETLKSTHAVGEPHTGGSNS